MPMARAIRPRTLAAGFGGVFVIVAIVAWYFASDLPDPWYDADLSRWVYTTNMLVAAIFLSALGGLGLSIRKTFNRQLRNLARRGSITSGASERLPPPLPEGADSTSRVDRDIDELLQSLSEIEEKSAEEMEAMEAGSESVPAMGSSIPVARELEGEARMLHERSRDLSRYLIGPGLAAALVLGISSLMLPGADAFAQTNHQLNTALILGIAYSWGALGAYVAATVYALVSPRSGRRSAPKPT